MPSRRVVFLILLFWTVTTAYAVYRDVWPRLFASGPPPVAVDLEDEATQHISPIPWTVLRGEERIGKLTTRMTQLDADGSLQFTHRYSQLRFDFPPFRIEIPELINTTRLTRAGELREQAMAGRLLAKLQGRGGEYTTLAESQIRVEGRVEDGRFVGHCTLDSPVFKIDRDLDPVAVPRGQALNPLQPVNRIVGIRPRQRWVVQEINPLDEALAALFKQLLGEHGLNLPEHQREPLIAEVGPAPESLHWAGQDLPCWVIEYRSGEARAKTWVRVDDGKVLRQEAALQGERIALVRDD
jgi:hypothetical protein